MAEALCRHFASDVFDCYSAGTEIKNGLNKDALRLIKEKYGIDMNNQYPKLLKDIPEVDIVITMGCNVNCPNISCKHREDWGLQDPTGKSDEEFIKIINQIESKILDLKKRRFSLKSM